MLGIIHRSFADSMHEVFLVAAVVALASAVLALSVRSRDVPRTPVRGARATERTPVALGDTGTPAVAEPALSEPALSEDATLEPATLEPSSAERVLSETAMSETVLSETETSETAMSETVLSETVLSETAMSEAGLSEGAPSELPSLEPATAEPVPAGVGPQPGEPVDSELVEAAAVDNGLVEAVPVESGAMQSEAVEAEAAPDEDVPVPIGTATYSARGYALTTTVDLTHVPRHVWGQVTAASGEPLAGASVTLVHPNGDEVGHTIAGEDGSFDLNDIEEGTYTLVAAAPHYRPAARVLALSHGETKAVVVLLGVGSLVVRVARSGRFTRGRGDRAAECRRRPGGTGPDRSDGVSIVPDLLEGSYELIVRRDNYSPATGPVLIRRGRTGTAEVQLVGQGHLYGAVSGPDGGWVPDTRVALADRSGRVVGVTRTDGAGSYLFQAVAEGVHGVGGQRRGRREGGDQCRHRRPGRHRPAGHHPARYASGPVTEATENDPGALSAKTDG